MIKRFFQANRTSVGILLVSLLFITLPGVGVGILEMTGYSIFRKIGPFYTVGLLCAGVFYDYDVVATGHARNPTRY